MRIGAGKLRGRKFTVVDVDGLRPTSSRVREALFSILHSNGCDMSAAKVLDLFAGSGLLSIEALSRGASLVTSVECNGDAVGAMRRVKDSWQLEDWVIHQGTLPQILKGTLSQHGFDVIIADPPYLKGLSVQVPTWLDAASISCRILVIEESAKAGDMAWPIGWQCLQVRKYGDTCLHFLSRMSNDQKGDHDGA
ncbi:MAG: RsmD family RNA methyltransferase [Zetaproteobacteria bacterium]|nr:RsmD family RNA methyltransferase [Zetaproteobacteria bacterium]